MASNVVFDAHHQSQPRHGNAVPCGWNNGVNREAAVGPKHIGILGMEVYTPRTFVKQSALEAHMGVSSGKFTLGLGQEGLGITGDAEDVNSICLTVVHSLLRKYGIDPSEIGRLEVGTETLVDKSKSTKTILMDLFPGNTDIEGATIVNACYGGTAALLNAFAWVESEGWDGRFAIVVAGDIAAYAKGAARPTSGAGAVAVLVGRDAPLSFDPKTRATHAANVWDFFKPDHTVEYPTVDGALSQVCYYQALHDVYERFVQKVEKAEKAIGNQVHFDSESADYFVFHAPYNKLVQKSYGRLLLVDARRRLLNREEEKKDSATEEIALNAWVGKPDEETYSDKELESILKKLSAESFKQRLSDANAASKLVGNTYTASVFFGLASLVDRVGGRGELTPGKSVVMFSYGSGALATMYRLQVRQPTQSRFSIDKMTAAMDLTNRLNLREEVHPAELDHALETRARMHHAGAPYQPVYPTVGRLFPGTYYLAGIDDKWRRTYVRAPHDAPLSLPGTSLAPPSVLEIERLEEAKVATEASVAKGVLLPPHIECVVTGTAAGLPGGEHPFRDHNTDRLLAGEQLIKPLPESVKQAMLEKNIVQVKKTPNGPKKIALENISDMVQLAGQLGHFDMTASYGVPASLAQTMDIAVQIAVAAGLEALKNAGLVSGESNDPSEWLLSENYRDTTGVVYASSFPAMDAAVGEVMKYLQCSDVDAVDSRRLISALRSRLSKVSDSEVSADDEAAFARLLSRSEKTDKEDSKAYEFDRKFLFRVLVLGNAQLAQLAGCRGPNTQTNAACAGTTQALAIAQDMLLAGRAERVVVIAGDDASGDKLMPWLGSGFRALGAASVEMAVEDAALPFDRRRSGMLMGAGGSGIVLETATSALARQRVGSHSFDIKARLLATQYSNSAYHGAAMDRYHIGSELKRFLDTVEAMHSISMEEIASQGIYFSHETCTHASDASSCAGNEVAALRIAFGDELLSKLLICNTKGFTGHPMGVSFEDVTAVEALRKQKVPPISNYQEKDDYLGSLKLSKGGHYSCRYALRFAAGFGSQVAFTLYTIADPIED